MIEPTDEMRVAAYRAARSWAEQHGHQPPDDRLVDAAGTALLALIGRDYRISKRRPARRPQCDAKHEDGTPCQRKPHLAGLHVYTDHDAGNLVIW